MAGMRYFLLMVAAVALVGCGELKKEADGITDRFDKRGMIDSGLEEKLDQFEGKPLSKKGVLPWQRGWPWWKWVVFVISAWSTTNLVLNFFETFKRPESDYQNIPPTVFRFAVATPAAERFSLLVLIIVVVGILFWLW